MKRKCVIMFDHESPEITYVVLNPSKGFIKKMSRDDMLMVYEEEFNLGNIQLIEHDDESLYITDTGCKTMDEVKATMLRDVQAALNNKPKTDDPGFDKGFLGGDDYLFVSFEALGFENEYEEPEFFKSCKKSKSFTTLKPEELVDDCMRMFEELTIDCDSQSAYSFIDTKDWKVVGGSDPGYIFFMSEDDYKKHFED